MLHSRLILLPGLDGTVDLFASFRPFIPSVFDPLPIAYPPSEALDYPQLLDHLDAMIPPERPLILLAESFSGPLAIRYAARHPQRVLGLILVATFVLPPISSLIASLLRKELFRFSLPAFAVRRYLVGPHGDVVSVKRAIRKVSPVVLTTRIKMVLNVDAREALKNIRCPILYLCAKQDRIVPPRCMHDIRAIRGDLEMTLIDSPHLLLQSNPHDAWIAIEPFIRRIAPRS